MPTFSDVKVTPGTGKNIATYSFTGEDSETKELQRIVINTSAGAEVDFSTPSPVTQSGAWTVGQTSVGFDVATTITRPNNTTAYVATTANVIFGALDLGVLGPSGKTVMITSAQLELDIAAIPSGMTSFRLYLYNVTPPSAFNNAGAWDLPSGDRASFLGYIDLGSPADLGSTLYVEVNAINKQVVLSGTHLFAYLVTNGGFTPAANSEVYKVTLHTVAL